MTFLLHQPQYRPTSPSRLDHRIPRLSPLISRHPPHHLPPEHPGVCILPLGREIPTSCHSNVQSPTQLGAAYGDEPQCDSITPEKSQITCFNRLAVSASRPRPWPSSPTLVLLFKAPWEARRIIQSRASVITSFTWPTFISQLEAPPPSYTT
jgi:hypothetical protein